MLRFLIAPLALLLSATLALADYDPNNAANRLALHTEITTDPLGIGYNLNGNTTNGIVNPLNDPNVLNGTVGADLTPDLLMSAWNLQPDLGPSGNFTADELAFIRTVLNVGMLWNSNIEQFRAAIEAMLPNGAMKTALLAQSRNLSAGERLFGEGTKITEAHVTDVINNGP